MILSICAVSVLVFIPEEENIAALLMPMKRNNNPCWKLEVVQVVEALRYWMALRAKASRTRRPRHRRFVRWRKAGEMGELRLR